MQSLLLFPKGNAETLCVTSGSKSRGVTSADECRLPSLSQMDWDWRRWHTHAESSRVESTDRLVCPTPNWIHPRFIWSHCVKSPRINRLSNEGMCVRLNRRWLLFCLFVLVWRGLRSWFPVPAGCSTPAATLRVITKDSEWISPTIPCLGLINTATRWEKQAVCLSVCQV